MRSFNMVHCLFEQSGTFRDAFRSLGISAADYDIDNQFGNTNYQLDLFEEIEKAYYDHDSVFDGFSSEDLVIAFFPCTHFSKCNTAEYGKSPLRDSDDKSYFSRIIARNAARSLFFDRLLQLVAVCRFRNIPLVVENPAGGFLETWFPFQPGIIDYDRSIHGDNFKKPTCWWFFGLRPFRCRTYKFSSSVFRVRRVSCGISRSLISFDYAFNFVSSVILGLPGKGEFQPDLFD